ncbi:HAD-IA family hydrolase [Gymnodinialimonas sp. 2305UL16-5]|uniref:HAD-IA family hydrolase n=1 Tax=Gymnodinialimonas mytili TaxID=3126503 RepID=UPI0030A516D0
MAGRHWEKRIHRDPTPRDVPLTGSLILFDVDGTLLDGGELISHTMVEAFHAAGETPPSLDHVRSTIGLSLPEMVDALGSHLAQDRRDKILLGYRLRYFDTVDQEETPPVFPGAGPAIERLRRAGFVLGITTGKARRSTSHMLVSMNWTRHFHTVQCADDNPSKPDITMVRRALLETGRTAAETILVGDSRYDMRMAKAAGIRAIGVSWGYNPPQELLLEGAMFIARDFDHLTEALLPTPVI